MVSLMPRWESASGTGTQVVLRQREHVRTNLGWTTWGREAVGASLRERPDRPVRPGEPISSVDIPEGWSRPGVIIQPLETTRYKRESLSTTWHRFFPEVSMTQGGAMHGAIERGSQPVAVPPYPSMI